MRRLAPLVLVLATVVLTAAGAVLGISQSPQGSATGSAGVAGPRAPLFVGLTIGPALRLARSQGVPVRIWRVPARLPVGTVMQQVSDRPVFLVVSTGPLKRRRAILAQAVGPPVQAECAPGFALHADGNAGPATCGGAQVNVATWNYFAASHPPLLGLGRSATKCQVAAAYDDDQLTGPMNRTVFELARAYYGWRFGAAFGDQLERSGARAGGCPGRPTTTP